MKILMAGCGNMGGAMLESWRALDGFDFTIVKPTPKGLPQDVTYRANLDGLDAASFDGVILAIKPQMMAAVAPAYAPYLKTEGLVMSMAAGVSLATLERYFPERAIVRIMPNLPAKIAQSMNGLVANAQTQEAQRALADRLADATGAALWVASEDHLDRLTAVSGSGPGYVFYLIEAYLEAAQDLGFSLDDARTLVFATLKGAVEMAATSDQNPAALRASVTSKNGTTQAGLDQLMAEDQLKTRFKATLNAAYHRARELSQGG
ncbi:pyrroline-5-carboxylate reductase [Woodsholea maritima]|uniref:pyrroline-5-carboxylate reductase n=1 Tax=Woodsholea maritima TaxID=240237 RepID=UPI0003625BD8|nr:pyrroline-5-carboxylate reductase [Woodsholea maritima]